MARSRTYWPAILAALFVITQAQSGWAENPKSGAKTYSIEVSGTEAVQSILPKTKDVASKSKHNQQKTWHVYRLDSPDPNLGQWVADAILEMIPKDKPGTVKYYAPGRILAVYHTQSVQAEVEAFLDNLKDVLPEGKKHSPSEIAKSQVVVPAKFPISLVKATEQGTVSNSGLTTQPPRHLIHIKVEGFETKGDNVKLKSFTIRYEGEGIIDSNLAWLIKSLNEQSPDKSPETGKPALNTADLTRYIKDLLGGTCPVPAYAPAALPEPQSTPKASEANKDSQPPEDSPAPTSSSAPAPKPEPAPGPKPTGEGPPPSGNPKPVP